MTNYYNNDELIAAAKSGDEEAYSEFLIRNEKLCYYFAHKYNSAEFEDLVSIAKIGLIKALNSFSLSKKIKFSTYAGTVINNEILMYFRRNKKNDKIKVISLNTSYNTTDSKETPLIDAIPAPKEEPNFSDVLLEVTNKVLEKLNERDKKVFHMHFYKNMVQKQIAAETGITQAHVSRLIIKFSNLLQKEAIKLEFIEKGDIKLKKGS